MNNLPAHQDSARLDGQSRGMLELGSNLEQVGKVLFVSVAVLYAMGLFITNTYLLSFGVSDFGLLKPRFVFTGLVFSVSYLLVIGLVLMLGRVRSRVRKQTGSRKEESSAAPDGIDGASPVPAVEAKTLQRIEKFLIMPLSLVTAILGTFPIFFADRGSIPIDVSRFGISASLVATVLYAVAVVATLWFYDTLQLKIAITIQSRRIAVSWLILVVLVGFHVVAFTRYLYPQIPSQWGGGRTQLIELYLDDTANIIMRGEVESDVGVELIWQNEALYLVRTEDGAIWSIRADQVEGANLSPQSSLATPEVGN